MTDEIIEIDERGKVHGEDPFRGKSEGEQLSGHHASAWSLALEIRERAGRFDRGLQASILVTEIEKLRALVAYWNFRDVSIDPVAAKARAQEIGEAYDAKA